MPRAHIYTHSHLILWSHKASKHHALFIIYAAVHYHWINVLQWMRYSSVIVEISAGSQWQHYQCLMYHCCHPGTGISHVIMRGSHGRVYLITDPLYHQWGVLGMNVSYPWKEMTSWFQWSSIGSIKTYIFHGIFHGISTLTKKNNRHWDWHSCSCCGVELCLDPWQIWHTHTHIHLFSIGSVVYHNYLQLYHSEEKVYCTIKTWLIP